MAEPGLLRIHGLLEPSLLRLEPTRESVLREFYGRGRLSMLAGGGRTGGHSRIPVGWGRSASYLFGSWGPSCDEPLAKLPSFIEAKMLFGWNCAVAVAAGCDVGGIGLN